jgi:hypothetical protein
VSTKINESKKIVTDTPYTSHPGVIKRLTTVSLPLFIVMMLATSGSTVITLLPAYLDTLAPGTHIFEVGFTR